MTHTDRILFTIVQALAEADGVTPEELEYTLADHISPDVLERIVAEGYSCELSFHVPGHQVTVTGDGQVFVDGVRYRREPDFSLADSRRPASRPCSDLPDPGLSDVDLADLDLSDSELSDFDLPGSDRSDYQGLLDGLPCLVYQSRDEPGWPIDFISEGCRDVTGYDPNAFIVGGVTFGFDLIHSDDRDMVAERVKEATERDEPFTIAYRILTAAGGEKWVVENGVALDGEGRHRRFVGVVTDVTELKAELDIPNDIPM